MSCRETPAGSALTTLARLESGLDDVQVLGLFHRARRRNVLTQPVEDSAWQSFLDATRRRVESHDDLNEARRESLLRRLDAAAGAPAPDAATMVALREIRRESRYWGTMQRRWLADQAAHLGISEDEAAAKFTGYMRSATRTRGVRTVEGYEDWSQSQQASGPPDLRTFMAIQQMESAVLEARGQRALHGPQRIERRPVRDSAVAEMGYDPDGGRLEVVFHRSTGVSRVYAYRGVPAETWSQMQAAPSKVFNGAVRNNADYGYGSLAEANLDSAARRCPACGQFAASSHDCPDRPAAGRPAPRTAVSLGMTSVRRRRDSVTGNTIMVPSVTALRAQAQHGPVQFPVQGFIAAPGSIAASASDVPVRYRTEGIFTLDQPEPGRWTVTTEAFRCRCPAFRREGTCPHVEAFAEMGRETLPPPVAVRARQDSDPVLTQRRATAAQAAVETALQRDWARNEAAMIEARATHAMVPDEESYTTTFAAFEADVAAAEARVAAGDPALTYGRENVLNGLAAPGSGKGFGVELEFDIEPGVNRDQALQAIGHDLYAAGLTSLPGQQRYHAGSARGYTENHQGGWSYERDCTVAGEIVAPIMYDTPETWDNITTVCEIVKRHGGVATVKTGSHVHVGMDQTSAATATELLRLATQHEDVLYRLSQSPDRKKHRPMKWCKPNPDVDPVGYESLWQARIHHTEHSQGVNLSAVRGNRTDHVEFRQWDGTLDPATVQAQIKLSVAMAAAAERNGGDGLPRVSVREKEPVGSHAARSAALLGRSRRKLTSKELEEDSATARSLLDALFSRRQDKADMAALWSVTRWHKATTR